MKDERGEERGSYCPDCAEVLPVEAAHCGRCGRGRPRGGWPVDDLVFQTLAGRYHLYGILGSGGFGSVYRATHTLLGGQRAVKVLRKDLAGDESLIERFWREARTLYQLTAPQLVKVEEYGRLPDGRPFMVMELAEGERLDKIVQRLGQLPALRALRISREILMALADAHAVGILHRDLKPENVIVHSDEMLGERVKLLDLGIARILGDARRLTSDTRTVGTPEYMSPEQWRGGDDIDGRADLYSLGIVLYEMLTGDVPFPRHVAGPAAIYTMVMSKRPEPVSKKRQDLPRGMEGFVFRLLSRDAEGRPADARAALEELEYIRAGMP